MAHRLPPRRLTVWTSTPAPSGRAKLQAQLRISMAVGRPLGSIVRFRLVSPDRPDRPVVARSSTEQFEIRPPTATLDNPVLLIRLAGMFPLSAGNQVYLAPPGIERAGVGATHPEQDDLGHVPEVEADATPVGTAVLPNLVPDEIGLVLEAPRGEYVQAVREQRVRTLIVSNGGTSVRRIASPLTVLSALRTQWIVPVSSLAGAAPASEAGCRRTGARLPADTGTAVGGPVTMDWATTDGSAVAGEDYTAGSGTLTFAPGETAKTVSVAVLDDPLDAAAEMFSFKLSNANGARIGDGGVRGLRPARIALKVSQSTDPESPSARCPVRRGVLGAVAILLKIARALQRRGDHSDGRYHRGRAPLAGRSRYDRCRSSGLVTDGSTVPGRGPAGLRGTASAGGSCR